MSEFSFHSSFYPPPRVSIGFNLGPPFSSTAAYARNFSRVFSEDNLSTLVVKHETEVSRKSSDKSILADNKFSTITNNTRHATSARPPASQNKARLSEFVSLIGWHDPNIYNCLDKPPAPKALNEFSGRTSHFLSTTCDECSLPDSHVSSSKASATSFHLSPKIDTPCTPRTKAQQKSEATLSTREVYSLVVGSPGLLPVPSAL
jgi:hypothetical protein